MPRNRPTDKPSEQSTHRSDGAGDTRILPAGHPLIGQAKVLLRGSSEPRRGLDAVLGLVAGAMVFPDGAQCFAAGYGNSERRSAGAAGPEDWIPILGRSAAGVPAFWSDPDEARGLTELRELVKRHASGVARRPASAAPEGPADPSEEPVQLITLNEPVEALPTARFLSAPRFLSRYPDVFALRIDGDSMAPGIAHGDLVLLSKSQQARAGRPAVVQLAGQVGVTCKVYRPSGGKVTLESLNEATPPTTVNARSVVWALRVLGRVRS